MRLLRLGSEPFDGDRQSDTWGRRVSNRVLDKTISFFYFILFFVFFFALGPEEKVVANRHRIGSLPYRLEVGGGRITERRHIAWGSRMFYTCCVIQCHVCNIVSSLTWQPSKTGLIEDGWGRFSDVVLSRELLKHHPPTVGPLGSLEVRVNLKIADTDTGPKTGHRSVISARKSHLRGTRGLSPTSECDPIPQLLR